MPRKPTKTLEQKRAETRERVAAHRAEKANKPVTRYADERPPAPPRDPDQKRAFFVAEALSDDPLPPEIQTRADVLRYLAKEAVDPLSPPGARVNALRAIDDLLPPERTDADDVNDPTPDDARRAIARYCKDPVSYDPKTLIADERGDLKPAP